MQQLLRSGLKVDSYQLYDPDEVRGINDIADLAQAAFILQKRLFRPRRQEEENVVAFGTGGWRAIIGEGFTLHNVRRLCQALANEMHAQRNGEARASSSATTAASLAARRPRPRAEVFAGNNIPDDFAAARTLPLR